MLPPTAVSMKHLSGCHHQVSPQFVVQYVPVQIVECIADAMLQCKIYFKPESVFLCILIVHAATRNLAVPVSKIIDNDDRSHL